MIQVKELGVVRLHNGQEVTILEVFENGKSFLVETSAPYEERDFFAIQENEIAKIIYTA